jgi:ABC-type Fe3+ transport system substrate-binding protein
VQATGMYPDTDVVVGVIANTQHKDLAKAFLIYLLENE